MKCKRNGVVKTMVMVVTILCVLSMAGCAKEKEPPRFYAEQYEKLGVDWDAITENLKQVDLTGTGSKVYQLYFSTGEPLPEPYDEFEVNFG